MRRYKRILAYTLVELMVVVTIVMLLSGWGMVSFFVMQDRQKVENTGKEFVSYLRRIQNHARTGDRGAEGGDCHPSEVREIVSGQYLLDAWATSLETEFNNVIIRSHALCGDNGRGEMMGKDEDFVFPKNWKLEVFDDDVVYRTMVVETLAGNTYLTTKGLGDLTGTLESDKRDNRVNRTGIFLITDDGEQYGYIFALARGAITTGCSCMVNVDSPDGCLPINNDCEYK